VNEVSPLTVSAATRSLDDGRSIAVLTLVPGLESKPAVFGPVGLANLDRALDAVASDIAAGIVAGVVLTGTGKTFCAGADLDFMASITEHERAREFAATGHRVFGRLGKLGVPVVAAINGVALGGGLELALHCTARIAARSVRAIGLPEISLGLLPGWGGTTLLPRLIGLDPAVTVIVENPVKGNKLLTAEQSLALGIVDDVRDDAELVDAAVLHASTAQTVRAPAHDAAFDTEGLSQRVIELSRRAANPAIALSRLHDVIASTTSTTDGFSREIDALADLICTPEFTNRVYAFHLTTQRARKPSGLPTDAPRAVSRIGVIGAGLMASQFVGLFAERLAVPVVMTDVSQERLDWAVARVRSTLDSRVEKGQLDAATRDVILDRVHTTLDYADFADCDFCMEAVFEDFDVKTSVLSGVEKYVSTNAVLATNTSSLSVTGLAQSLTHPERMIGFHFFNPVAVMPLIEVVETALSDGSTIATAVSVAGALRKAPVLVQDRPGFVVNRVLSAYLSAVFDLVDQGVTPSRISEALSPMRFPMDPFALVDLIGRTVTLHMLESLHAFAPERINASGTLRTLEAEPHSDAIVDDIRALDLANTETHDVEAIRIVVEDAIVVEIDRILAERVVHEIADVDLCLINGAAWPVASGGISKYLDQCGASLRARGAKFHPVV
jgi:3-hydroxyacyl-CoA dehydrogenase/enoyl-CoA hydratase/carnithine racemase